MKSVAWGAVLYGALTGLAGALLVFVVLGIAGLDNDLRGQSILIFLTYAAFMVAGFVAGRFSHQAHVLNGGLAAMVLFALQVVVSGATTVTIVLGSVVAAVIGSAGGALGQWVLERRDGGSQDTP